MIPAAFVEVDAFPLTPNGKINRHALPEPPAYRAELAADFVAPRSESERIVADIWCEVLAVDSVGVHENFFALGGHSLLATRVLARMRQAFEVELNLRTIFELPTVAGLARAIDEMPRDDMPAEPALKALDRDLHRVVRP
jgi:acyl carrier protein